MIQRISEQDVPQLYRRGFGIALMFGKWFVRKVPEKVLYFKVVGHTASFAGHQTGKLYDNLADYFDDVRYRFEDFHLSPPPTGFQDLVVLGDDLIRLRYASEETTEEIMVEFLKSLGL